MKKIYSLISPAFPNGVTYLLNILLELNLLIYRCKNPKTPPEETCWNKKEGNYQIRFIEYLRLGPHLPSLRLKKYQFKYISNIFHWDHPSAYENYKNLTPILVVRDPRDSLYSWYKRRKKEEFRGVSGLIKKNLTLKYRDFESYENFLSSPSHRYSEIYKNIQGYENLRFKNYWTNRVLGNGTMMDELVASYELCLRICDLNKKFLFVRFEDMKSNPNESIKKMLEFCEMDTAFKEKELELAVQHSSLESAQRRESGMAGSNTVNRRGQIYEWKKNHHLMVENRIISENLSEVIEYFGYDAYENIE
jgi:hypothetical protein